MGLKSSTDQMIPNLPLKTIMVAEIPERKLVEVSIRGEIDEVFEYANEIATVQDLSVKYEHVVVYINSPGGSLMTCIDLMAALKLYKLITTIAIGEASSAGLILWSIGHIRVVDEYTIMMAHRESYGNYGKTSEHLAMAQTSNRIYERLYKDTVDPFLTKKEREQSQNTEVWIDALEMIKRGHAISLESYRNPTKQITSETIYTVVDTKTDDEVSFVYNPSAELFILIDDIKYRKQDNHIFGVDNLNQYIIGQTKLQAYDMSEAEETTESIEQSNTEESK
jgi:ATP-dependent protease ClpP protease subunit